jgi:NADH-quinone oxidoreductase subunit M
VALIALLHFLTAMATGRTKMRRFSLAWSLVSESVQLAMLSCTEPWLLIGLLVACVIPPYAELRNRGRTARIYALHMGLYVGLLVLGWACFDLEAGHKSQQVWAAIPLLAAILIRCGTVPMHCWMTDWLEHASFGNALLFVTPLSGVYAAVRLVLPIAPDWVLQSIGLFSLVTAAYAAGMAVVQQDTRRFFAYLFLSHASLILVGLELHTSISLTGALSLWIAVSLSLAGFGLTLRALEARFGRLSLAKYHGLYDHSPTELLVEGAIEASPVIGIGVILTASINGIAVVRAYFALFTGARHASTVSLAMGARERFAVLTLAALIVGGGLVPQPWVASRYRAATTLLQERARRIAPPSMTTRQPSFPHEPLTPGR